MHRRQAPHPSDMGRWSGLVRRAPNGVGTLAVDCDTHLRRSAPQASCRMLSRRGLAFGDHAAVSAKAALAAHDGMGHARICKGRGEDGRALGKHCAPLKYDLLARARVFLRTHCVQGCAISAMCDDQPCSDFVFGMRSMRIPIRSNNRGSGHSTLPREKGERYSILRARVGASSEVTVWAGSLTSYW